jgi:hypothetical protein
MRTILKRQCREFRPPPNLKYFTGSVKMPSPSPAGRSFSEGLPSPIQRTPRWMKQDGRGINGEFVGFMIQLSC